MIGKFVIILTSFSSYTKLDGSVWVFKAASDDDMGNGPNPDQIVKIYDIKQ